MNANQRFCITCGKEAFVSKQLYTRGEDGNNIITTHFHCLNGHIWKIKKAVDHTSPKNKNEQILSGVTSYDPESVVYTDTYKYS